MFKNYLKIGVRNLLNNKLFSLINISGMAISIATFLIIALFVADELKFDKHVKDVTLKYRLFSEHFYADGNMKRVAMVAPMVAPTLKSEFPEVESYARIMHINSDALFQYGEKKFTVKDGGYADSTIFDMLDMQLVEGDRATGLSKLNGISISQSVAKKLFGNKPALNENLKVFGSDVTVTSVFADFSDHSHLKLNYFFSMENLYREIPKRMEGWGWSQFHSYIKLKPGADPNVLESKLEGFAERNAWSSTKPGFYYIPHLMRMDKIHLHSSDLLWDIAVRGSAQTVYILAATAFFILIVAILNFINLSTAKAINRVKEVGVRKVVGALRSQLIYQFISESIIIALISLMIGGLISELLLPALNSFTEKHIPTGIFLNPVLVVIILASAIVVGILTGAYPAFYISSYKPAHILSNKQSGRAGKNLLRKSLVVLQFVLSFFLIIAALVVSEQHHFMRTTDMGFNKDNLVIVSLRGDMEKNLEATKNSFVNHPNVISGTLGYGLPGEAFAGDGIKDLETNKDWPTSLLTVDHDYIKTLGLKIIAGRDFNSSPADERHAFILSETAVKMLGIKSPEEAIGHDIAWDRWDKPDSLKRGEVIGVVKDINLNSAKDNVTPVVIQIFPFGYSTLTLRVKPDNLPATIAHFESTWKKFNNDWPFEYRFLDDNFDKLYKAEEKLATLFTFFTSFTIFVACLGLFGLVVYSTTQKYKEISIRKVLGAEESSIVVHLGKDYLMLIVIAFLIAIPFSYYAASAWLQKFVYRIDITPLLFIKAGLFIVVIALLTVGIQSLKAARTNPVNALKEQG
jgi:putative ABC transport system permease protein